MALFASLPAISAPPPALAANPAFSETADATWMTNGVGRVYAIDTGGNKAFFGGSFTGMRATYNGSTVDQRYVAGIDVWTGDLVASFDPVVNGEVRALVVSPDAQTVYIGGVFDQVNGQTRTKVAALDATTGNLRGGFNVTIPAHNVEALAVTAAGDLYVGGSFASVNGQAQRALALVDGQTGALKSFDAGVSTGKVQSLLLTDDESRLYIGTSVNDVNGDPMFGSLFAVDPVTANPIPGFDASTIIDPVLDIATTDDKIYIAMGGGGGEAQILRVSNGSRRVRFGTDGDVQAVEVIGDRAYFAGHWVEHFGTPASFHFIAVDVANDQLDDSYYPRLNGTHGLSDLHYDGYHFWMGGEVTDANPVARRGFARYSPVGGTGPLVPLIDSGARWTYLDDGSQLGSGWRNVGFNDSSWRRGAAELGYGDGDEATVVRDGPDQNRYITTYFRRDLLIYDHTGIGYLEIQLKRDDGAVVYINGSEVIRDNMPSGAINGSTLAASATNGTAEDVFTRWIISPQVLVEGENVVAVEVHQESPTSNDVSFDLRMLVDTHPAVFIDSGATWRYRDDGPSLGTGWRRINHDDSSWKEGSSQLGYGDGDEATVIASGPAGNRHITSYFRKVFAVYDLAAVSTLELELLRDDGAVVYLNEVEVARSNMPSGPIDGETRAAALTNKAKEGKWFKYSIDPALLVEGDNVLAIEVHQRGVKTDDASFDARLSLQAGPEVLFKAGTKWRYHDKGVDKGTKWRNRKYKKHTNWSLGKAELGYGDGDEVTVIESGPDGAHYPTVYFRKKFRVTDPDVFSVLDLSLVRDDGAVVYINGQEVLRTNMPGGTITFDTWASNGASGEGQFHDFTVPATALRAGMNVVAVEIHQVGPGSSDVSFNLELTGR